MARCGSCNGELTSEAKFCPHCGRPNEEKKSDTNESLVPTYYESSPPKNVVAAGSSSRLSGSARSRSGGDSAGYRFPPGTILGERFRIVGPLGRGGMGEVYRADDLKLAQSVALKFLPENLTEDQRRLDLLYNEVRLARSVSHPSVCRVYDIGEIDGQHFLSMEFIDGEDLSSLLRRIGRLPSDKGIEIARQICGGLYAAHERGVIHLDLKPANIMLDGRGKVRITDFGLARLMTSDHREGIVGTPAYMAPEQLAGGAVGEHSDVYALGLIFHEIFTGKPVFRASSIAEMIRLRDQSAPSRISSIGKDIDPVVDKIIQRCLSNDPAERPPNVVQIAAALPGGDPLAAAVAAGETPSPELIAASGGTGGISPRWGLGILAIFLCLLIGSIFLMNTVSPLHRATYSLKPDVLEDRARNVSIELLGLDPAASKDSAFGFWYNPDNYRSVSGGGKSISDGGLEFWYRQSSGFLSPNHPFLYARQPRMVTLTDPPAISSGMVGVRLTGTGKLREISAVPSLSVVKQASNEETIGDDQWARAFVWAGLDFEEFQAAECQWTSPWAVDQCFAWIVKSTEDVDERVLRVEAATIGGKICYFQVIHPWTTRQWTLPTRIPTVVNDASAKPVTNIGELAQDALFFVIGGPLLVVSIILAIRNLKSGTTDEEGAIKFAGVMLVLDFLLGVFEAHHNASLGLEISSFVSCLINALGRTVRFWIYYLALEPFVRRIWPKVLVSWNRLLQGRFTDPHVSQEILYGCITGALVASLTGIAMLFSDTPVQSLMGRKLCDPFIIASGQGTIAGAIRLVSGALPGVFTMLVIIIFRLLTRNNIAAILVFTVYMTAISTGASDGIVTIGFVLLIELLTALTILRFGLLALITFNIVRASITSFPISLDVNDWFFSTGLLGIVIPFGIALTAFVFSMGDQSPLRIKKHTST